MIMYAFFGGLVAFIFFNAEVSPTKPAPVSTNGSSTLSSSSPAKLNKEDCDNVQMTVDSLSLRTIGHSMIFGTGTAKNISKDSLRNLQAELSFYTADGKFVESAISDIKPNPLVPGKVASFSAVNVINNGTPEMKNISLKVHSVMGDEVNIVTQEMYNLICK
ncbi:hypothetical protein GCM10008957_38150 [Deinococcus ruber]|uniref:Uncharacterized protein n=2 Tax=Deinococcus ruber TaxID=1848197 RepID=A0A918CGV8_9DEIO|nr:hypothetical protein GCM10008957_38150 [Deinococcus ruber]